MFDVYFYRKEIGIEVHQEEGRFKLDARFYRLLVARRLVGHGVQRKRRLVAAIFLREGSSPCLTSLEPAMELTHCDN